MEVNLGGEWGVICSQDWDLREANVACRQMGLQYAANAYGVRIFHANSRNTKRTPPISTETYSAQYTCKANTLKYLHPFQLDFFGGTDIDKFIAGLECDGSESKLSECFHHQLGRVLCPERTSIAGVVCTDGNLKPHPPKSRFNCQWQCDI